MKDNHIISILESAPLADLGDSEMAAIRAHTARCDGCRRAYEAARISASLLRERAALVAEPPPFFETKVLAALRERRAANEGLSLRRLWRNAGALVSGMAATVAALAVLTFIAPITAPPPEPQDAASAPDPYAAEEAILAQYDASDEEITYGQVLTTIYELEDDAGR